MAGDFVEQIGPFSTLDNAHPSVTIPNSMSSDLQDVDISPGGKSVKKRKGYATAFTLSNSTSGVKGVYIFYDSNGSDVALSFNDTRMNVSVSGGSPTVFMSTGPNGATYQCVDGSAYAYCANTSRTSIVKVNSSGFSLINTVNSTGTILAITPERLVMAGFSEAPNRIDFSKPNDFATWTVGATNATGLQITITASGSKITHLTYAHGRVYWFKDNSFGYVIIGPTDASAVAGTGWQVVTVNNNIGTLYNTSIFRDDILYFQGQDGHFYAWDGSNLTKLSTNIQATIAATQGRISGAWTQTAAADFGAGFSSSTVIDTTTVSGQVQLVFQSTSTRKFHGSSNIAGGGGTCSATGPYYYGVQFLSTQSYVLTGLSVPLSANPSITGTVVFNIMADNSNTPGTVLISSSINAASIGTSVSNFYMQFASPYASLANGTTYWIQMVSNVSTPGNLTWWSDGISETGLKASCSSSINSSSNQNYVLYGGSYPTSGTWQSSVKNAASLTSWDNFNANYLNGDGSHSFFIRSATGSFTSASSTPAWTAISNGAIPTVSTGTYFQIRDVIATPGGTTPILYDFTQNWVEGSASDKTYALYHDNALWWSVASGAGATTNNKILKYDLLNQGWLIYNIPMNGMYERSQALYFGAVDSGKIHKFGDVDNDNGTAINSYWKSKDFFGTNPFLDKSYNTLSVFAGSVVNSSMTVTWTVNGSSSTNITMPLYDGSHSFLRFNKNLPQRVGNTINVKFGNNAIDQPFEVYGIQVGTNEKPWNAQ